MADPRIRSSVVCLWNDKLLTIRAEDPVSHRQYLFLPGGSVEPEETAPEAGERETREETGYEVQVDPFSCIDKEYLFHWSGADHDCLTFFYRARLLSPLQKVVNDAPYIKGVVWLPREEIIEAFSYSEPILETILALLEDPSR